jgi:hypothetical protein
LALVSSAHSKLTLSLALQLLFINGLNLLPLLPLDGGRLVSVLFASKPRAQAGFAAVSQLVFTAGCWYFHEWLLFGIGAFLLGTVPMRYRKAIAAGELRAAWPSLKPLALVSDHVAHDLYVGARHVFSNPAARPRAIANVMRQLHEQANVQSLTRAKGAGLLLAYLLGFGLIAADFGVLSYRSRASARIRSTEGQPTTQQESH